MARTQDPAQRYGVPVPEQQAEAEKTQELDQHFSPESRQAAQEMGQQMQAAGVEMDHKEYEIATVQEANQPVIEQAEGAERYAAAPEPPQQQPESEPEPEPSE